MRRTGGIQVAHGPTEPRPRLRLLVRSSSDSDSSSSVRRLLRFWAIVLIALGGFALCACGEVEEVALVLASATQAAEELGPSNQAASSLGALDCGEMLPRPLAAMCVQVYTVRNDTIAMEARCHDAPAVATPSDLAAFLRGLGPLADGLPADGETKAFLRILGYESAARAAESLVVCGVTPSLPGHLDRASSPTTLPLYLLCHDPAAPASEAGALFDDYCGSSEFVALFP